MDSFRFWLWLLLPCLAVHFFLQLKRSKSNTRRLPPGPFPLPIVGNIFQLGNKPHKSLAELAKTHGPLMTLQLGQLTTVIVSSATMAKEVLQKNDLSFSNRQTVDASHALSHHDFSMAWLPVSAPWRTLRKISNSHLFSSNRLDANRHLREKKVQELLSYVQRCCDAGVAVDIGQTAFDAALNLLSNTLFSMEMTEFGSNTSSDYKKVLCGMMAELGKPNYADYFPVLKKFDPQGIRYRTTIYFDKMMDLFNTMIDRRLQAKKSGSVEVNDVLDVLLDIKQENGQELERSYILHLLLDLFAAGTDTTSGTLEWAMTELLHNPNKLKKAQAELKHLIDSGNQVEESNIAMLPYLQSIVKETLRLHPAVPFLLPRKVNTDVQVCGFTVPKNAQVLVNAWAIGRDASLWKNPNDFEPERFLELDIDVKGRNFELIPFGGGRRICPGLPLAIRMVSLMLGSLIHSFNWKFENENEIEKMDMDDKFGLSLQKRVPLRAIPTKI